MIFKSQLLLAALLMSSCALQAQSTLLVLSKQDHTIAMVDPATLQVIAKVPVGNDPHEVVASADGSTAYVSNYGSSNTINVIDLVSHKALPPIDTNPLRSIHGLAFVGGKPWFTAEGSKVIARYDPATKKVDWILGTGQNRTHMIDVSPDQKQIITTNVSSGTVSIIDLLPVSQPGPWQNDWNQTVIPVGHGDEGFDLSPGRKELWVANAQDGTISVIDMAQKKVVQTLNADVPGANRLKFTPDGHSVLVSTLSGPNLTILDAATRQVTQRIPIGHGCAGILVEPNGNRAFIGCTLDDYVVVLDLHTFKVTGHIQAGGQPDGVAWAVRH